MHCGHLTARAKKPEAASRRALSTDQRQETPYVPSPAFVRARSATDPEPSHSGAAEHRRSARSEPRWLPRARQRHQGCSTKRC